MPKIELRCFYRPHKPVQEKGELVNPATGEVTIPPSLTKQEFVRECDINNVIKAYSQTGQINHINAKAMQGAYQDLPDPLDFQESLHLVQEAERAFATLPAKVRDRFGNDPVQFLAFTADPANVEEMRELGLAAKAPPAAPTGGDGGSPPSEGAKPPVAS